MSARPLDPLALPSELDFLTRFLKKWVLCLLVPAKHFQTSIVCSSGAAERTNQAFCRKTKWAILAIGFLVQMRFWGITAQSEVLCYCCKWKPDQGSQLFCVPYPFLALICSSISLPLLPQSGSKLADAIWSCDFQHSCRACEVSRIWTEVEDCSLWPFITVR